MPPAVVKTLMQKTKNARPKWPFWSSRLKLLVFFIYFFCFCFSGRTKYKQSKNGILAAIFCILRECAGSYLPTRSGLSICHTISTYLPASNLLVRKYFNTFSYSLKKKRCSTKFVTMRGGFPDAYRCAASVRMLHPREPRNLPCGIGFHLRKPIFSNAWKTK